MKTGVIVASIPPNFLCVCVLIICQVLHMQSPSRERGNVISPIFQMKKLKFFPKVIQWENGHPRLPWSKAHAFNHHWHFTSQGSHNGLDLNLEGQTGCTQTSQSNKNIKFPHRLLQPTDTSVQYASSEICDTVNIPGGKNHSHYILQGGLASKVQ